MQERDPLTDPAAADYYGAGNAEKVAAARDKARRKLMTNHSRESSATPAETPGKSAVALTRKKSQQLAYHSIAAPEHVAYVEHSI